MKRRRAILAGLGLVALLLAIVVVVAEADERSRYGTQSAVDLQPTALTAFRPFVDGNCRELHGMRGEYQVMWLACPSQLGILAEYDAWSFRQIDPDAGRYEKTATIVRPPAGADFYVNCGNTRCSEGFDLMLLGRKGNGFWAIRASVVAGLNSDKAIATRESEVASMLIDLWVS